MTRGKFILLITTICLILGFGIYYFYSKYTTTNVTPGTSNTTKDFSLYDQLFPPKTPTDTAPDTTTGGTTPPENKTLSTRLHQISYKPIAGYGLFTKGIERLVSDVTIKGKRQTTTDLVPVVRYVDQKTGIIYEQDETHIENRISNTTIPNTYEVLFSSDGTHIIYRFLDKDQQTILTYIGKMINDGSNKPVDLTGNFIYQNIKDIKISEDGLSYFILKPKSVGVDLVKNAFDSKNETVLFSSPLSEWNIDLEKNSLNLTTKPSGYVTGYSYNIDNTSGSYSKTLSGPGLTEKTSNDSLYKIYSVFTDRSIHLFISYNKTGIKYDTGLQTLSEKCVYNTNIYYCAVPKNTTAGTYPDEWYQGSVSFNDGLWLIDTKNQKQTFIEELKSNTGGIDATNLQISKDGKTLYFIDKKTSLLWAYDL